MALVLHQVKQSAHVVGLLLLFVLDCTGKHVNLAELTLGKCIQLLLHTVNVIAVFGVGLLSILSVGILGILVKLFSSIPTGITKVGKGARTLGRTGTCQLRLGLQPGKFGNLLGFRIQEILDRLVVFIAELVEIIGCTR